MTRRLGENLHFKQWIAQLMLRSKAHAHAASGGSENRIVVFGTPKQAAAARQARTGLPLAEAVPLVDAVVDIGDRRLAVVFDVSAVQVLVSAYDRMLTRDLERSEGFRLGVAAAMSDKHRSPTWKLAQVELALAESRREDTK